MQQITGEQWTQEQPTDQPAAPAQEAQQAAAPQWTQEQLDEYYRQQAAAQQAEAEQQPQEWAPPNPDDLAA